MRSDRVRSAVMGGCRRAGGSHFGALIAVVVSADGYWACDPSPIEYVCFKSQYLLSGLLRRGSVRATSTAEHVPTHSRPARRPRANYS